METEKERIDKGAREGGRGIVRAFLVSEEDTRGIGGG